LEVGITYNKMLCNDFTGPARFRLNMPKVALELKRVWHPCSRAFSCSLFACFLLFQTGKNRMQLNYCVKRCGVKNQNRRQKVLNRGLKFSQGAW